MTGQPQARSSSSKCLGCGEEMPANECPESTRPCGHHCDCSWTQDECCWCGRVFGEESEGERQRVIHLPSGRKGTVKWPMDLSDRPRVRWSPTWESPEDHMDLRTLPKGRRV